MRRETLVVGRPLTAAALESGFAPDPRHETFTLVRHRWQQRFAPIQGDLFPGDEVVFYEFDRANEDDLRAMNAGFSPAFYVAEPNPAWPDELRVIAGSIPASGARVLEVCCGAGRLAAALVRDGNRVAALDASAACVAHARARDRAMTGWVAGDARALPFGDRAFDVACIFENSLGVLFSGKARALEELVRVARSRAILGLREEGGRRVHTYWSGSGYMEAAETFTAESAAALIDGLSGGARGRIATRVQVAGDPRPWGGRAFFVVLDLGS